MIASLLLFAQLAGPAAADEPVEWRAGVGGQIDPHGFGTVDLGVRQGPWSAELLADTLQARFDPQFDRGRAWVGLRAEGGATGLIFRPWANGAPSPARGFLASSVGPEAGAVRYTANGTWLGVQGSAHWYWFGAMDTTGVEVPDNRLILSGEALFGWWTEEAEVLLAVGADWNPQADNPAPHVRFHAYSHPDRPVAPNAELRVAFADHQSFLTRTRVGGLNPYVVPVAGAAWAEYWVEDYIAVRIGPMWRQGPWRLGATVDMASIAGLEPGTAWHILPWQVVWGAAARSGWRPDGQPWFVDLDVGIAPGVPRADSSLPWSTWFAVGRDWQAVGRGD